MSRFITFLMMTAFVPSLQAQVGIGTNNPQALFHVAEGSVIFTNTGDVPSSPANSNVLGTGRRMMWYADKAAFRTGYTTNSGTNWNMDSIGNYSASFGRNTKAKGIASFAGGYLSNAMGDYSTAFGYQSDATGNYAFASGYQAAARGNYSAAFGNNTQANGHYATAFGYLTSANGDYSTCMGQNSRATAPNSTAMGYGLYARGFSSTVVGIYNQAILVGDEQALNYTSPLFIIGNGVDNADRSNALVVRRWGGIGIGTNDPQARLHIVGGTDADLTEFNSGYVVVGNTYSTNLVFDNNEIMARNNNAVSTLYLQNAGGALETGGSASKPGGGSWSATSDIRLKQDITPYRDGLQQLLQINPVYYRYNQQSGYDTKKQYVGVIAQDIKKIAPYMVGAFTRAGNEYYNVDNTPMTYMLINAVKEQQQQIMALKAEMEEMKKSLQK